MMADAPRATTTARPLSRPDSVPAPRSGTSVPSTPTGSSASTGSDAGKVKNVVEDTQRRRFVNVIRGYDRIEVDEYIDDLLAVVATLRSSVAEAERGRREADERLSTAERHAGEQPAPVAAVPSEGFGMRAERLLRLAESEAAEIRAAAANESSSIVEKSRAAAEQYRHEAEQALIARSAQVDQEAARRTAALDEREGSLKAQIEASRGEIEMLSRAAQREADRLREQAAREIEEQRAAAGHDAARAVEAVEKDVARLVAVRESTREELRRVVEVVRMAAGTDPEGGGS